MSEQREDDYYPPAATEQERLTTRRFEAHFAFYMDFTREDTECSARRSP